MKNILGINSQPLKTGSQSLSARETLEYFQFRICQEAARVQQEGQDASDKAGWCGQAGSLAHS